MTSLSLIIAPLLALQSTGEAPVAIKNDDPETWTLEYPRIIQPYIEDYRRCLTGRMRTITGEANFEAQHRSDVPSCADVFAEAQASANAALSRTGDASEYPAERVRAIFENIARIHIARGADLDSQFSFALRSMAQYEQDQGDGRPNALVLEMRDASVVKARTDATADAAIKAREEKLEEMEVNEDDMEARGAPD